MKHYGIPEKMITIIKAFYKDNKVAVINGPSLSEWFDVKSGVKQGCVMSGFLFLLVIDWIMRKAVSGRTGLQWSMMEQLEDLDYADDLVSISSTPTHAQQKLDKITRYSSETGLKINVKKTKVIRINAQPNNALTTSGTEIEDVVSYTYLGGIVTKTGGTSEDIQSRIWKARVAYYKLNTVWKVMREFWK